MAQAVGSGKDASRALPKAGNRAWRKASNRGREQSVDQQRALLCRMAAARFGADTAARLANVLAPIANPERLAEIGERLGSCDTADGFLARLDPGSPSR